MNLDPLGKIGAKSSHIKPAQQTSPKAPVQGNVKADTGNQVAEQKPATVLSDGVKETSTELSDAKSKADTFASAWNSTADSAGSHSISNPENTSVHGVPGAGKEAGFSQGTVYSSKPLAN